MRSESVFARHSGLIGCAVRVESADLTFTTGVLYCIDPESDSVALLSEDDEREWSVKILLGHSVVAIHADEQAGAGPAGAAESALESIRQRLHASQAATQRDEDEDEDSGAMARRRAQLCAFLRQRFVPCEESGSAPTTPIALFGGVALIAAPFTAQAIACANEQILARLEQLLAQFEQHGAK